MWARLAVCFLAVAATSAAISGAEHRAWQIGKQYEYKIRGRTLAALHDVANQYNGVLLNAKLRIQPQDGNTLNAWVIEAKQAEVHQDLPGGWGSKIEESTLNWIPLLLTEEPFLISMKNGVVSRLTVSAKVPVAQVNLIKGLVSQLQVDTKGENMILQKKDDLPSEDNPSGVYSVMEDTVTGKCEVQYDVSELPKYIVQSRPEIVPMPELAEGGLIDIVKTSNYSRCDNRPEFHFGFDGNNKMKPASSKMGQFFARSSISRVVLSGNVNKYTIQSAITTHKAIISPALYNTQKGMVVSRMNMTLSKVEQTQEAAKNPTTPIVHKNLVYKYETEAMKNAPANRDSSDEKDSSVEVTAPKDFRQELKKPCTTEDAQSGYGCEDYSFEQNAALPKEMDNSIDMLLHPNFAYPTEAMDKQKVYSYIMELSKEIGQELDHSKAVLSEVTLSKFNVLITLIRSARTTELKRATSELYTRNAEDENPAKVAAWSAFRDAVAEAGSGPALLVLKDWIMSDLVKEQEAAELLAVLPRSARLPHKKYIQELFELVTSQKVKQQQHLNSTAVLSFAELVRLAQVDEKASLNRYPTHIFGRLNPKEIQPVVREYIPYFKNALKKAVHSRNSARIHLYIRVLGNFGHPKIVDAFEPYLSGKVHITNFQRQAMVAALFKLTETYPRIARAAFTKIYQNVADAPQVRAMAVINLMNTNPPTALLQRMAESVNFEHNPHVRAIVKSAIESAAQLNAWDNWEVKSYAESARNMLNYTDVNAHLSQMHLKSNDVKESLLSYEALFSTIGSQDSLFPQTFIMKLRQNLADLKLNTQGFELMASSVEEIAHSIFGKFDASKASAKKPASPFKTSHGWSIEDILSEMSIVRDQAEPIEATLLLQSLSEKRFYSWDNETIQRLPYVLQKTAQELRQGKSFNYTKMYNQYTMAMSFPTATGYPFYYTLSAPVVLSVGGKARVITNPQPISEKLAVPETVNATADIHIIAASKVQAQLGFVDTLTLHRYSAGVDKDMRIRVPVQAQVDVEIKKKQERGQFVELRAKIQPIGAEENFEFASLRSKPYLAKQSLQTPAPLEQIISVRKPIQANFTVGHDLTGMAIRVDASTEMKFADFASLYNEAKKHDAISALTFLAKDQNIHQYELKLSFDSEKSITKSVELTAAIETHSKKTFDERDTYPKDPKSEEEVQPPKVQLFRSTMRAISDDETASERTPMAGKATLRAPSQNPANPSDKSENSHHRRTEFLKKASKHIEDADAMVVDLSASFKGKSRAVFVATAAAAMSEVSDQARALLYLRKKSADQKSWQLVMSAEADIPRVPFANFGAALKTQPDISVKTSMAFGEEIDSKASEIDALALLRRTKSQRDHVRRSAMGKLCLEQMHKGNNYLPACQNATLSASKLNAFFVDIAYDRVSKQLQNATYQAYSLLRDFGWQFNSESVFDVRNLEKNIVLESRFDPEYQSVNMSITAPTFNSSFDNVRLNRWVSAAVVAHPTFNPASMLFREGFHKEHFPMCNVGQTAINTFSNKTYPMKMGRNWHAVLVSAYKKKSAMEKYHNLVVLARETTSSEHQKEVIVLCGPNVIEMTYARDFARVNVNGKTIKISTSRTNVFSDGQQNAWAMLYGRPDGSVKIVLPIHNVKVLYDRTNLAIRGGSQLRDQMRGLCGMFNDDEAADFTVPRNCIVRDAKDFAASYIVRPTGNAVNEQQQAKDAKCIPKKYHFGSQLSSAEESFDEQESARSSGCVTYKVKAVEQDGKMCFSKHPQPTCNAHCSPSNEIEKKVDFVCAPDREVAAQWKRQIKSGSIPSELSRSPSAKSINVRIPETCQM